MKFSLTLLVSSLLAFGIAFSEERIDFNRDIRPLISSNCIACHGPDEEERKAGLRLDTEEGAREDLGGYAALVPGKPDESELLYRLITEDESEKMPPKGKGRRLNSVEVATIKKWIEQGGNYAKHWAYEKPVRSELPSVERKDWPKNAVDNFILDRLEQETLAPSPEADRWTLARRLSLDLIGLPPTWEKAKAFVEDQRPDAYERYVDGLLANPAFGERWARVWLDLARYADSAGYADDPPRIIWPYRDWVIRSINANMPFDQFTIEQIAGDLLETPTKDQLVATAFHRNTMTNNEGGTNNEEFRNVAVVDRVNTTMEVWMGTTMACAQCHTHKYDPITHAEYFQLFDFFNQSEDSDQRDERPFLELWSEAELAQQKGWKDRILGLEKVLTSETPELAAAREEWLEAVRAEPEWVRLPWKGAKGAKLEVNPETPDWITLQGEKPEQASYEIELTTSQGKITGLRLEVSPDQIQNFVLSQLSATWNPSDPKTLEGRFVRVELPGEKKMIHLAEVEVFSRGSNIALKADARQSSTDFGGNAKLAIDGKTDGDYAKKSVSHTAIETDPWFEIDLGGPQPIDQIVLWNRTDSDLEERLKGYKLQLLDADRKVVWEESPEVPQPSKNFALSSSRHLTFTEAVADHSQAGFPPESVLASKADPKKGWAIGGQTGKPHQLSVFLKEPMEVDDGTLTVHLQQHSEYPQHLLTAFRITATESPQAQEWARMPPKIRDLVRKPTLNPAEAEQVATFHRSIAPALKPKRVEIAKLQKQLKEAKPKVTVPVMRDLPQDQERTTAIHLRGNYKSTGKEVRRATPAVFHPLREDLPPNRLALAHWLIDPENPLTARVVANRYWEQMFGTGIVETSEEFGSQGDLPSHPELLDWLAVELMESGWDSKAFMRLLVRSATYRQSSKTTPELLEIDPFNRFLARGPRFRISAEMVRDQALSVSGLLSSKMFGPPVHPPQPELGLKAAFGSATDWKTSDGEDKYRRGIYTTWRRSSPYPSMATFDAPNREVCTSRRGRTNTPLQALVTLNDPVYVEAAQAFARKITAKAVAPEERARFALQTALVRPPSQTEIARVVELYQEAQERFSETPEDAKRFAIEPLGPLDKDADPTEIAAWSLVGNVLLNLDEMFLNR